MPHAHLSDVQLVNLTQLLTIKHGLANAPVDTCCRFAIDAALADILHALPVPQVMALIANVREETLFPPRADLKSLLSAPLPLSSTLAAVRARLP